MLYGVSLGVARSEILCVTAVVVQLFIVRYLVVGSGVVDM